MYELNQCTPTQEQMWLLQAALQQGDAARQAWQQWRTHVNLDDIDLPSYHLLPLVYHNLVQLNVEDDLLGRLKGIYRHTWSKNKMLFYDAQQVVAQFTEASIRPMFVHSAAMSIEYYQDNTRFMTAIDILVPQAQFLDAVAQLEENAWHLKIYSNDELRWFYKHQLRSLFSFSKGHTQLNLHCMLLPMVQQREERYWKSARNRSWHGQSVAILNPTQQLFHTCIHGMTPSHAYLTWIPDALAILSGAADRSSAESTIDWQALVQQAEETRQILPLVNTLTFLVEEFQAPIPPTVLSQLGTMTVTFAEKEEYNLLGTQSATARDRLKRLFISACRYQALHQPSATPIRLSLTAWIPYLFLQWQLDHWWQWPKQFMVKLYNNWQRRRPLSQVTAKES